MAEQYFTRPNIEKVIGKLGTTPEQRGLSTQEFKDKFDEMPEAIQQYLINTLLPELDSHVAENASKHITESGSNENGYYIKFDDGTMICWGRVIANNITATTPMTYGGYRSAGILLTFPATFHSSGGVPVVSHYASNSNVIGRVNYASTNFSSAQFVIQTIQAMDTGIELTISFSVVGRWKAYD